MPLCYCSTENPADGLFPVKDLQILRVCISFEYLVPSVLNSLSVRPPDFPIREIIYAPKLKQTL